jgi:hypothetical protein
MSVLEEIESRARNAEGALGEAQMLLGEASRTAQDLEESAAAHGWAGVAEAMATAQEALDHSSAGIDGSLTATTEGLTVLAEITEELSKTEVAGRLARVQDLFTSAQNSALDAINALDDAKTCAQQTDAHDLLELLTSAEAHLDEGGRIFESAAEDAAAEQSAAEVWGEESRRATGGAQTPVTAARKAGSAGSSSDRRPTRPGSPENQKISDVLKHKKGSIKNAPLGRGSPSSDDFSKMTMRDIEAGARANEPGYKTALKLLRDRRFNR